MHPSIGTVAEQFRITTNLFIKAMSGVDKDDAMRRPGQLSNPLLWLAGCAMGWILVVAALRFDTRNLRALAALILNVPNTLLAGIFSLAAVMSD